MYPASAEAAAVSGEQRHTLASFVPLLPSKLRLNVRRDTPPELGEKPMPMQGPQAHSRSLAPAEMKSSAAPLRMSSASTCLDPGETETSTLSATVLPRKIAAAFNMSYKEELVQEPIHT